jgi:hypothetical protein
MLIAFADYINPRRTHHGPSHIFGFLHSYCSDSYVTVTFELLRGCILPLVLFVYNKILHIRVLTIIFSQGLSPPLAQLVEE